MKKIIYSIAIAIFAPFMSSCSGDWLDLAPSNAQTAEELAILNHQDAKNMLTGAYQILKSTSSEPTYYAARMIYRGDVAGDDMQATGAANRSGRAYVMNYSHIDSPEIWEIPYKVIRRANTLILAIEGGRVQNVAEKDLNDLKGQALTLRALAHFDLVRIYGLPYYLDQGAGLGVPIMTTLLKFADTPPGRNTVAEVYTQVEKDLTEAISLLKDARSTGYFNKWGAKFLLSRVHLYKGTAADNQKAFDLAVDVIKNSPYKLWTNSEYAEAWKKQGTSEVLFEIVITGTNDWTDREGIAYLYSEKGYADAIMTKNYLDLVDKNYSNDVRKELMLKAIRTGTKWTGKNVYINKYPGREGEADFRIGNVPLFRLSETYLIAAEAASKLGNKTDAAKYLNDILLRGTPSATPVSENEINLDRILQEKRVEFVGEGHRFYDLMRNGRKVVRYTSDADIGWHLQLEKASREFDHTYFRAILPIPDSETSANGVIAKQQNPGY